MAQPRMLFIVLLAFSCLFSQNNSMFWQTTHNGSSNGACRLESNKINVTIHPFHMDVEEEAVIIAEGSVFWGDAKTLEIVSEFSTTPGTAIRSMLLWNGNQILKAKLCDKKAADSLYEATVDRSKPQPIVRDPAIIEQIGANRYRVRIYPLAINTSRKIRILYSVPMQAFSSGPSFSVNSVFSPGASAYPAQTPLTVRRGATPIVRYVLSCGSTRRQLQYDATYLLQSENLRKWHSYYYSGGYFSNEPAPFDITPDSTGNDRAYEMNVGSGIASGRYCAVFASVPDSIKNAMSEISEGDYTLEARIMTGTKSYIADNPYNGCIGVYLKTALPWDRAVYWTLYDRDGYIACAHVQHFQPETGLVRTAMLPLFWAAKYSLDQGNQGLGALYGFVDSKMSLLALERDSMPQSLAVNFTEEGVPPLLPEEVIVNIMQLPNPPVNDVMFEIEVESEIAAEKCAADDCRVNKVQVSANGRIFLQLKDKTIESVVVALYDLRGRLVSKWTVNGVRNGRALFEAPHGLTGQFVIRVKAGKEILTGKAILR